MKLSDYVKQQCKRYVQGRLWSEEKWAEGRHMAWRPNVAELGEIVLQGCPTSMRKVNGYIRHLRRYWRHSGT